MSDSIPASAHALRPTVFIVDDDELARYSITALVESMGLEAQAYESADRFLREYDPDRPGCVVTDLRMSGISGLQLQQELQHRGWHIPVIVITAYANTVVTVTAMRQGAVTLLEKPASDRELWQAIVEALEYDAQRRKRDQQRRRLLQRLERLSPGERDVLELILEGLPNKVIARRLGISLRTVEARRHNIFRKTGTDSVAQLVRLVLAARQPDLAENSEL